MWHDTFIHVTWHIHACDKTCSYMWHDSFVCNMTYSCVGHEPFIHTPKGDSFSRTPHGHLLHGCDMTLSHMWWLIHTRDITHPYAWHYSFIRVTLLIHTRDITHPYTRRRETVSQGYRAWRPHRNHTGSKNRARESTRLNFCVPKALTRFPRTSRSNVTPPSTASQKSDV